MKIYSWNRRAGKTSVAIEWLLAGAESGEVRTLITHTEVEARRVRELATELARRRGIISPAFKVVGPSPDALRGASGPRRIDNLDLVLETLYGRVDVAYSTDETA